MMTLKQKTFRSIVILSLFLTELCVSAPAETTQQATPPTTPPTTTRITTPTSTQTPTQIKYKVLVGYPKPKIEVTGADDTYYCLTHKNKCEKISRYYVADNVTFSCYNNNIEIYFDNHLIIPDVPAAVTGFIQPSGIDNNIKMVQTKSKLCLLIRRFELFFKNSFSNFKNVI
jgi:hypothetical protein